MRIFLLACYCLYLFLYSTAFAQSAKLVEQDEWGSGRYEKVVEINGYYYVKTSSNQIDVFDPELTGKDAFIDQINLEFEQYPSIIDISKFQDSLAILTHGFLTIYSIEGSSNLTEQYKVSIHAPERDSLVSQGNSLFVVDYNSRIYKIEENEGVFSITKIIQEEEEDYSKGNYIGKRSLYISGSTLYYVYSMNESGVFSTKISSLDVNNLSQIDKGQLESFNYSHGVYVGGDRFVLASYQTGHNIKLVKIIDNQIVTLSNFPGEYDSNLHSLTYKDNVLRAFSYGNRLFSFEISATNTTSFLSEQNLNAHLPEDKTNNIVYSQWIGDKYIALSNRFGLIELELEDSLVTNIELFYNQSGPLGKGIIKEDALYLPRGTRIDVIDIADTSNIVKISSINEDANNLETLNNETFALTNYAIKNLSIINNSMTELNSKADLYSQAEVIHKDSNLFMLVQDNGYKIQRYTANNSYALYEQPFSVDFPQSNDICPQKISIVNEKLIAFDQCVENKIHIFTDFDNNDFTYHKSISNNDNYWLVETIGEYIYYFESLGFNIKKLNPNDELEEVSFINTELTVNSSVNSTDVVGDFLFVITTEFLHLFDISTPINPKFISKTKINKWELDNARFQVSGEHIIATTEEKGKVRLFNINTAPTANLTSLTLLEDETKEPIIAFTDPESDLLTYSITSEPSHGQVTIDELGLIYTPNENFYGEDSVTIKAQDIHGNEIEQEFIVTITAVNDEPAIGYNKFIFFEDEALTEQLNVTDVESEVLIYEIVSTVSNGDIELDDSGEFTYVPHSNYFGQDQFTFKVSDQHGASAEGVVKLSIVAVNDAPSVAINNFSTNEDTELVGKLNLVDVEAHSAQFELIADSVVNGSVTIDLDGSFVFNPSLNFYGEASFSIKITDSELANAEYDIIVNVNAVNDAPVAKDSSASLQADESYSSTLPQQDSEGDPLLYVLISDVANGTLTFESNGEYTYVPLSAFSGTDSFVFEVTDGVYSSQAKVNLTVQEKPTPKESSKSGGSLGYFFLLVLLAVYRFRVFRGNLVNQKL